VRVLKYCARTRKQPEALLCIVTCLNTCASRRELFSRNVVSARLTLSNSSGKLYVYTVTPTSIKSVPGSPFKVANLSSPSSLVVRQVVGWSVKQRAAAFPYFPVPYRLFRGTIPPFSAYLET
jgi:hypothetical protein